ncbi:MAG: PadR family transcriptional regulator, regulatory protein PadR [Pseudonocardiales bacterium]|nr:PadR family transcriptional regulator, regulatory protein PadR [Pseudonocardiales bacterium]
MTIPTQRVLASLLGADELCGADIGREAGLPSGTVHPILARLEGLDWATSLWEDVDPRVEGRPPRRYYRLTTEGRDQALTALAKVRRPADTPGLARPPRPAGPPGRPAVPPR